MREKIKSIILFILVINSLVLTSLLIFYHPDSQNVSLSEYLPRLELGSEISHEKVIEPKETIFHFGENKHTLVKANKYTQHLLVSEMSEWSFYDFTNVDNSIDWRELIENRRGVELIFPSSLPDTVLSINFKVISSNIQLDEISRLWIFIDEQDNVQAYFISDKKDKVYLAKSTITSDNLNNYLSLVEDQPNFVYHWSYPIDENKKIQNAYYIPNEEINLRAYNKAPEPLSINDFIQLLFIDPSIVKKVDMDNENTMLFTDGNRSMQYYTHKEYISFFQPVSDNSKEKDINKDLFSSVRYINRHGGWDGDYNLSNIDDIQGGTSFIYRLYLDGYEVIDYKSNYGVIEIKVIDGIVSTFERSIILLNNNTTPNWVKVNTNDQLMELLEAKGIKEEDIQMIEIIYLMKDYQELIILEPYWRVKKVNGEVLEIPISESVVQ